MGSSSSKITDQDKAILNLKLQRDKLQQYSHKITVLTTREDQIARTLLSQSPLPDANRRRALLALRRKKYQESLLAKTDTQLAQLESLVASVEFALIQKDVVFGLQEGTRVLKEINAEMGGLDKIERMMEDNNEARAYQEEVANMLSQEGRMSVADEEEVEDELAALEAEIVGTVTVAAATKRETAREKKKYDLPEVPVTLPDSNEQNISSEPKEQEESQKQAVFA